MTEQVCVCVRVDFLIRSYGGSASDTPAVQATTDRSHLTCCLEDALLL